MNTNQINIEETEVARIVRGILKANFPSIKFSVKTKKYSGGSSITVYWMDGPAVKEVEAIAGSFHGASFDGMIDLKEYHTSEYNGQAVTFDNDFIFFERDYSDNSMIEAVNWYKNNWSNPSPVEFRPKHQSGRYTIGAEVVTSDYSAQEKIYHYMREQHYA